jgi:ubiquinone/menaquinone biosynthesis C-methylase UbiE
MEYCTPKKPYPADRPMKFQKYQDDWENIGERDPYWGILSHPGKRGGKWDLDEFFDSGRLEVDGLMEHLGDLFDSCNHNAALDFGCGVGRITRSLAKYFNTVIGIDISNAMIRLAAELNSDYLNCSFMHNPKNNLKIIDSNSIDFLYSHITLQHIPNQFKMNYLMDFCRVLSPGGLLVFQCPSNYALTAMGVVLFFLPKNIIRLLRMIKYKNWNVSEMHPIRRNRIENFFSQEGMKILKIDRDASSGPYLTGYRYVVQKLK